MGWWNMSIVLNNNKRGAVGEYIKDNTVKQSEINISSSIFTIYAYEELKEILDDSKNVKFLFNEPTFIKKMESNQKEVKEFQIRMRQREKKYFRVSFGNRLKK